MLDPYLPLWGFIVLMVSTPGPANMLLMSAGAWHGFVRVMPFLLGLVLGKLAINGAISLGLATVLQERAFLTSIFGYISAGLMAFLVLRGWTPKRQDGVAQKPFGVWLGLIIHPLSPKAWTMAILAATQFSNGFSGVFELYILIPLSFLVAQCVFHSAWCLAGAMLKRHLAENLLLHRSLIVLTLLVILWALVQ